MRLILSKTVAILYILFFYQSMLQANEKNFLNKESSFICSTPQVTPFDQRITLQTYKNFSATDGGFKFDNNSKSSLLTYEDYAFALKSAVWKRSESLNPELARPLRLGVAFLDGDRIIKEKVLKWASEWTKKGGANVKFLEVDASTAQIRISFQSGYNDSSLGNQARKISNKSQPTMRLSDVGASEYSEKQWKTIVLHEFGHALGLRHEHLHPKAGIKWNEDAIFSFYYKKQWARCSNGKPEDCKEDIRNFITKPLSVTTHKIGNYDDKSIMIYPIYKNWTHNGYSVAVTNKISPRDLIFINGLYPK